jgi:5-methylcytosine-specific restriction endonuclease McrA
MRIAQRLPAEVQRRYDELIAKRDTEALTSDEHAELLRLSQQAEAVDVLRVKALTDLAQHNLALACQGCNNHKYNRTQSVDPVANQVVPLFHPRRHEWHEHFTWDECFELVIGLTPIGRATIEALQLNRHEVVKLRRLLYAAGEHPPPDISNQEDTATQ